MFQNFQKLNRLNRGISTPIAIFVIVVVAIACGGLALWQYSEIEKETAIAPSSEIQFSEPNPATSTEDAILVPDIEIDTTDWEIYRNESFGYEVKYPKNWTMEESCCEAVCRGWRFEDPFKSDYFFELGEYAINSSFNEFIQQKEEYADEEYYYQGAFTALTTLISKRGLIIEDNVAIELVVQHSDVPQTGLPLGWIGNKIISVHIPLKNDYVLQFDVPNILSDIFYYQILPTFKFIE